MAVLSQTSSTFVELISSRAELQPNDVGFIFLKDGLSQSEELTYGELDMWARQIARQLRQQCDSGDRVLLLFPSCLDYIAALFGCFYAGVIAVPAYPPNQRHLHRLQSLIADAGPAVTLTTRAAQAQVLEACHSIPELAASRLAVVDCLDESDTTTCSEALVQRQDIAFLQYTSGSTGRPKGVVVTHENLIYNQQMIESAFGHTQESTVMGWLPMFHDMGLVGNVLQPLYLGVRCVLMWALCFLQRPARWLRAISDFEATTSGGPNFAYDLCVEKVNPEEIEGLDLSCWEVAFSGSEVVRAETLRAFTEKFSPYGFRNDAFYPCYGMAEATLLITGGEPGETPKTQTVNGGALAEGRFQPDDDQSDGSLTFVGCGTSKLDECVRIVDQETFEVCSDGYVGEIWVCGKNVAAGYWGESHPSRSQFDAAVSSTGEGPFLRTGDLGVIQNGEIYITGRIKETLVIRGQNFYPTDIERTVQSCNPLLRRHNCAVFSVDTDSGERVIVVQEIARLNAEDRFLKRLAGDIQEAVTHQFGLRVHSILFVRPGSVPKTSSGKTQRHTCREQYLSAAFDTFLQT